MRLGTSLRFLFPTSSETYEQFQRNLAAMPPGGFIDRPMGDFDTATQAQNLIEVAQTARDAGLDTLLVGDNHAVPAAYANCFQPVPTLGRLMAETGTMETGMVLLAPFYHPVLLAEQLSTLAAFARAPLVVVLALGGNARAFSAFGMPVKSRVRRLEELVAIVRPLLAGERLTYQGKYFKLDGVQISPLPQVPVSLWVAGTVHSSSARAGVLGDAWLSGQNASMKELAEHLDAYREAAVRSGKTPDPVLRRDIFVGADDADAWSVIDPILQEGYRGTGRETLLVGGPDTIVQMLREYRAMGFERVLVRHIVGDHQQMLASFRRIGSGVLPAIRDL